MSRLRYCLFVVLVLSTAACTDDDDAAANAQKPSLSPSPFTTSTVAQPLPPMRGFPSPSQPPAPNLVFGSVTALSGTCPVLVVTVAGQPVATGMTTQFRQITCVQVVPGRRLRAFVVPFDGRFFANLIEPF
jgi:hypothetical protein